jgi:heptosyltransferase II
MSEIRNIVVLQTAFIGDVLLTLPLIQAAQKAFTGAKIDIVVTPRSHELFAGHPLVREAISFDKRGADRGLRGLLRVAKLLRSRSYDLALIPHRSLRSAALALLAGVPMRIGFDTSAGRLLLTKSVAYRHDRHEIDRNLSLLNAIDVEMPQRESPRLYPSEGDQKKVDRLLIELEVGASGSMVAIAPGTVWNTKRWLKERFSSLAVNLDEAGLEVVLLGGHEDESLCAEIRTLSGSLHVYNTAGMLSLLQSAELIRRCKLLVCNDSAPMHLAAAVGTPVVAVFGATIPGFGFGPSGPLDVVVETQGLKCRPCSIHGGEKCPIKTFDCMKDISYDRVFQNAMSVLSKASQASRPSS